MGLTLFITGSFLICSEEKHLLVKNKIRKVRKKCKAERVRTLELFIRNLDCREFLNMTLNFLI